MKNGTFIKYLTFGEEMRIRSESERLNIDSYKSLNQPLDLVRNIIKCEYCSQRYWADTRNLYCTQCGAPLPTS